MVAALRHESVSQDELSDSSVCSSSDDWGFVVSVFGLREHHGVRERFGLQDLVLEPGSGNSLVQLNPCLARSPSRGATKPWIHGDFSELDLAQGLAGLSH